jgi:hypothetical protein
MEEMKVPDIISLGAVLVAFGALIWQMRQTNKQARLQNFSTYTQRYENIMLNLPIAVESNEFTFDSFSTEEKETILRWLRGAAGVGPH